MTGQRWQSPLQGFVELLMPERCRVCNRQTPGPGDKGLCSGCFSRISYLLNPICGICGSPHRTVLSSEHRCGGCLKTPPPYAMSRSAVIYQEPVKELVHRLKYRSDTTVLPALQTIIEPFDVAVFNDCELIVPVPLHPRRLRQRGLNQAHSFAKLFFPNREERIILNLLKRIRETRPQTGLDGAARRENLRSAFEVSDSREVQAKSVCLVDDVYTTGTTVGECAGTLLRAGAAEVKIITFARVVVGSDP